MKILILFNYDLASNYALNLLLPELQQHQLKLCFSTNVGNASEKPVELEYLTFVEQQLLKNLIFPYSDNLDKGGKQLYSFESLSSQFNAELKSFNYINDAQGIKELQEFKPELILSVRFGKILKQSVIDIPSLGVLNLHSGILPQYQGVMATFWAMKNQASEYGSTLHWIDSEAIDAGPVITLNRLLLDRKKSYLENVLALYPSGCFSMVEAVNLLASGKEIESIALQGSSNYYSFPQKSDLDDFHSRGLQLVNPVWASDFYRQYLTG
ncbi:formyl transferase [Aliikangiella sp. G2MR2-5]|uniref:formyl transferase n=1 Tax=Aliikangiella sp. G2MR2-5 TaxID=2788943 RepID=UPI0018A95A61|nr:formyl transferase [Aliikangiella sp. G2MR2-5]